jgi:hypothetical protein
LPPDKPVVLPTMGPFFFPVGHVRFLAWIIAIELSVIYLLNCRGVSKIAEKMKPPAVFLCCYFAFVFVRLILGIVFNLFVLK